MNETQEYTSQRYRWIYNNVDKKIIDSISSQNDIPKALAEVLIKRDIISDEQINEYFNTPLNSLINPFLMKDMDKGVERICAALYNNELICIFGDYDVDGVTSTSMMYLFIKGLGGNVMHYIPNRLEEGYGLNVGAIEELKKKHVKLIVTVDCGISAVDEVATATKLGIDVVITDHHQPGDTLPDTALAIINPIQDDDNYSFKNLSGVGVAFKFCMAIRHSLRQDPNWKSELPNLKQYLDIITLGTIADVVPLQGENRTLVIHGLKILASPDARPGLSELKKVSGITRMPLNSYHVGFNLAPRINAVGRLGDSDRGFRLLITDDLKEAQYLAQLLDQENKFRQSIERDILEEVFNNIETEKLAEKYCGLVLYSDNWHPGVLGIVASRVADRYHRPTIVLTAENGVYKGSARSIPSFHLYNGLKEMSDMLLSFGGHKYAAGIKVALDNISQLQHRFDFLVKNTLAERDYIPEVYIDAFLKPKNITDGFMTTLQKFEPYGNKNAEPLFCIKEVSLSQNVTYVGKTCNHAKCYFEKDGVYFEAIGYDMKIYESLFNNNKSFDILFTLSYNNYGKSRTIQLVLKDIRSAI